VELVDGAHLVATDAPQQVAAQGSGHFLAGSAASSRIRHLGSIDSQADRTGRSVFLSAGLAGTEVLVADALLRASSRADLTA